MWLTSPDRSTSEGRLLSSLADLTMSSIKKMRGRAIALFLLLGVGVYSLHAIGPLAQEGHTTASDAGFAPSAIANFDALSLPARVLPARLRRSLESDLGIQSHALNPASARKVSAHAWLVGGRQLVCLVADPSGAAACSNERRFARRGIFLGTFQAADSRNKPSDFLVLGAVPDWVANLEIEVDGNRTIQPVKQNVVRLRADSPILVRRLLAEDEPPPLREARRDGG